MFKKSAMEINHIYSLSKKMIMQCKGIDTSRSPKRIETEQSRIVNQRISFYCRNTNLLPPKPKTFLYHLKLGIQEFYKNYVLAPADKAANNVVVV